MPGAYPLNWPEGWKRTPAEERRAGRFSTRGGKYSYMSADNFTVAMGIRRVLIELELMRVDHRDMVLSTNLLVRLDGQPRSGQAAPKDPGAALYWSDPHDGTPRSMAIDQYTKVEQNIAAIASTLEHLRGIERHGGAVVMRKAFTGFAALPAPIVAGAKRHWREVLGFEPQEEVSRSRLDTIYRAMASHHHPDRGGDPAKMAEINAARDEALKEPLF